MNFSVVITRLRDYFVIIGEPAKAELCNSMLVQLDEEVKYIYSLTKAEAEDLVRYFHEDAGYISYEKNPGIHKLIDNIQDKLYGPKKFKPIKKRNKEEAAQKT